MILRVSVERRCPHRRLLPKRNAGEGTRAPLSFAISLLLCATLHAQPKIVDTIAAASDPEMTYAAYVPASASGHKSPVVFVLDPRRRGAFAAELFRPAADEYGWIVISSNNTESDSASAPNNRALHALLIDAPSRFPIDENRMYLAGFSGTANLAFSAAEKTGAFAGVIGCSGWLPPDWKPRDFGFAWFGTAGTLDFNFLEARSIDERLGGAHAVHRAEFFEGPHRWAPPELLTLAVGWMELQAMRRGAPKAPALISRLFDADVAAAAAERDPLLSMRRYEAIARTFEGLSDVTAARARAGELRRSTEVARALKEERRAIDIENGYRQRLPSVYKAFLQSVEPPVASVFARELGIARLQKLANETSYTGAAAQRVLAAIHGRLAFYLPQQVSGPRLNTLKTVAAMIRPSH